MPDHAKYFPIEFLEKFEIYNYNHAIEILSQSFREDFDEVVNALCQLKINIDEIRKSGGNQSDIPPKFSDYLEPLGWKEIRITGDLIIKFFPRKGQKKSNFAETPDSTKKINDFIDGHNIDLLKNRVALDIEWNSKDQTFDRDLFAMRTYYECDVISVGIIITRSEELNDIFKRVYFHDDSKRKWVPLFQKYGASTTWMGKLLPRLDSRRHGGCPLLAIGIKKACVADWKEDYYDEHEPTNI